MSRSNQTEFIAMSLVNDDVVGKTFEDLSARSPVEMIKFFQTDKAITTAIISCVGNSGALLDNNIRGPYDTQFIAGTVVIIYDS